MISYSGLVLQDPEMFPQPTGHVPSRHAADSPLTPIDRRKPSGTPELVAMLMSLSVFSAPLLDTSTSSPNTLTSTDIEPFLQDIARRFEPDNEIDLVLGPVVRQLLFHETLWRPGGLAGGDAGWRGVIGGLEALISIKSIAIMITRMEEWLTPSATAATFERVTLMGPLCRLGVFPREWVRTIFQHPRIYKKNRLINV